MKRPQYRRRKWSTVWHFAVLCQWWPVKWPGEPATAGNVIVRTPRPTTGTLCDHCQRLEKKSKKIK